MTENIRAHAQSYHTQLLSYAYTTTHLIHTHLRRYLNHGRHEGSLAINSYNDAKLDQEVDHQIHMILETLLCKFIDHPLYL